MGKFSTLIDTLHVLQSVIFVTGSVILPVEYLPVFICLVTWMLSRYHDYCFISEITRSGQNFLNGCREDKDFTRENIQWYNDRGIPMTRELSSNILTALLAINIIVSLYRLSKHYKFPILFTSNSKRKMTYWSIFVCSVVLLVTICEIFVHFLFESDRKLSPCYECSTPASTIWGPGTSNG